MAEHNHMKKEESAQMKAQSETNITYNGARAVVAIGVLGVISYYIYQSKTPVHKPKETLVQPPKKTPVNKFDMD